MSEVKEFKELEGTLVYVSVQEPVKAYVKPGNDPKPDEWKASVVLTDEDMVDDLEAYAKSIDTQMSVKKVKAAEFEGIYKTTLPEGAGKNVWVITLRKSTELGKTGKPVPDLYKPKVFEKVGKNIVEITNSKLVGNGSYGKISIDKFERTNGNASLYLKNILVTKLVEYTKAESDYVAGSEFNEEEPEKAAPTPAKKQAVKPAAKRPVDDLDDDIPF